MIESVIAGIRSGRDGHCDVGQHDWGAWTEGNFRTRHVDDTLTVVFVVYRECRACGLEDSYPIDVDGWDVDWRNNHAPLAGSAVECDLPYLMDGVVE